MSSIFIKKNNGKKEKFKEEKIRKIILRLGGDERTADKIITFIYDKYNNKTVYSSTIFNEIREFLKKENPKIAKKLNLKNAILKLGPAGYNFEKYVASILKAYGYNAYLPEIMQGACITHEVDVVVERYSRSGMIEAKFRHSPSIHITIKDTMSTWARFIDLVEGAKLGLCKHFDEAWIVTNAKFSQQSLQYGHCKNMVLLGWNHPKERTFAQMIDLKLMYPITILENLPKETYYKLIENNIILCSELLNTEKKLLKEKLGIKENLIDTLFNESKLLLS